MVIAATQSVVVHREAVIGSEEVKRMVSLAELFQPFDDGLPYETSIEPTRRWSRPRSETQFANLLGAHCQCHHSDYAE